MKILKATVVTILFLLIPHQAPFAGPSDDGGAALGVPGPSALTGTAGEPSAAHSEPARREAFRFEQGFVWSVATSSGSPAAWHSNSGHLETDGYSWSARSTGSLATADPVR